MKQSLAELAERVGGDVVGDATVMIDSLASAEEARAGSLTFAISARFLDRARHSHASAVVVPRGVEDFPKPTIRVDNPRLAFAKIQEAFMPRTERYAGIHPTAVVAEGVTLGKNVSIGPHAVVERGARVDDGVTLSALVYVGTNVRVGADTTLLARVTIMRDVEIGRRVVIHPGTVVGADGFGFVRREDRSYYKIPQMGRVIIEDDVEIGANVAIDRATLGETRIGRGTKIDNLVHIAHNVHVGKDVAIVALVGISGSSSVGDGAVLAGQAGVTEYVTIGENTVVAAKAGVTKNIAANQYVSGFPARNHAAQKRIKAITHRLPRLLERVARLERIVGERLSNATTAHH